MASQAYTAPMKHYATGMVLLSLVVASVAGQLPNPQTTSLSLAAVTVHQRIDPSCALVQPAALIDNGKYASIALPANGVEVYSPELSKDDFLVYSKEVPEKLVKLAHKSGFRVQLGGDEGVLPRVVGSGTSRCPSLEEALPIAEHQRLDRRRQAQSKVYHVLSDRVTPPVVVSSSQPKPDQQTTTSNGTPGASKTKIQGTVIVEIVVNADGTVPMVKVVRSLTSQLDKKAVEAVKSWTFQPSRKDGLPVPVQVDIEINFHLY